MKKDRIKEYVSYCHKYGLKCFIIVKICSIFNYKKRKTAFSWHCLEVKHKVILSYLFNQYKGYFNNFNNKIETTRSTSTTKYDRCIWTAWLQGEENAPDVIQLTIASMKQNSNGHQVIVLTNANVKEYINLPNDIEKKYLNGIITNAHFADIIRMMVISKYGGLWLDATTYVSSPIDDSIFNTPFFSINKYNAYNPYVSKGRWVVGILGGCDNSHYLYIISAILNQYWLDHDLCIDYFVFDYIIALLYRENEKFKEIVETLEPGNDNIYLLREIVNEKYDERKLKKLFSSSKFFILPHRKKYLTYDNSKHITNYAYLKAIVNKNKDIIQC